MFALRSIPSLQITSTLTKALNRSIYSHIIEIQKDFDEYRETDSLPAGVKVIQLALKSTRNALSNTVMQRLIHNIKRDEHLNELRCIVLSSADNVFSAGHDLKELLSDDPNVRRDVFETAQLLMKTIIECPVPVIAKVNGVAAAAGCQLVAQCDLAIASDHSKFSTPGIGVGLFCSTPSVPLSRAVPRKIAMQMLLTGDPISASEALKHGLVNRIVPESELNRALHDLVISIIAKNRETVTLGKRLFYRQIDLDLNQAYTVASQTMLTNLDMDSCVTQIRGFFDRKKVKK